MRDDAFDRVAAALAQARTRRAWLAALWTAIVGFILGDRVQTSAGQLTAAPPCRGKRGKCKRHGQCCSRRCRKRRGKNGKKGRCRCSRYLEPCRSDGDCCALNGMPLVCASGMCQT